MIDPYISRREDRDPVPVRLPPPSGVGRARPHDGVARGDAVVDVHIVDDHVAHVLEGYAPVAGDVDVGPTAVDCLEVVEYELVLELDHHA